MKIPSKIIRNIDIPACKNCVYYRPRLFGDFASPLNKCHKFGVKNIVTDEITYYYADIYRTDGSLCGKEGKYFEKEPRLFLKKIKHQIFRPLTILVTISISYLVAYYITFLM